MIQFSDLERGICEKMEEKVKYMPFSSAKCRRFDIQKNQIFSGMITTNDVVARNEIIDEYMAWDEDSWEVMFFRPDGNTVIFSRTMRDFGIGMTFHVTVVADGILSDLMVMTFSNDVVLRILGEYIPVEKENEMQILDCIDEFLKEGGK